MAWIRIAGHDRDLIEFVSVGGSDAAAAPAVGDQPAGGAVVRLLPATPAQHQPLRRRHHAILHMGTVVAMAVIRDVIIDTVTRAADDDDGRWAMMDMV